MATRSESEENKNIPVSVSKVSNVSNVSTVSTSFQRKSRTKLLQIPGTKASVHSGNLLTSTGVTSLNTVLGGGLTVGSLLLIGEDECDSYSRVLLRYFLAEGVMNEHEIFLASAGAHPDDIIQDLPSPICNEVPECKSSLFSHPDQPDAMKIAWRYQNLPKVQATLSSSSQFGRYYDLSTRMEPELLHKSKIHTFYLPDNQPAPTECSAVLGPYASLLQSIHTVIRRNGFDGSNPEVKVRNVLRVALHSLGSALWGDDVCFNSAHTHGRALLTFLYALRALLRSSLSVAMVTIPAHLIQSECVRGRIIRLCDSAVSLHTFTDSERKNNPMCKDHHGLLRVLQVPHLNCLMCEVPDTKDLAFRLKRKQFTIERMFLPPDQSGSASQSGNISLTSTCSSHPDTHIDF